MLGKGRNTPEEPLFGARLLFGTEIIGEGEHEATLALAICIAVADALARAAANSTRTGAMS